MFKYIKKKWKKFLAFITGIFVIGIVYGATLPEPTVNVSEFNFNGRKIVCEYADNNIDENLIIRTDKSHYGGWNATEIFFSIENISNRTEIADIQFYFAGEEILANISELKKDVPYNITVNDYGVKDYECEKDWVATTTSEMGEDITQYICLEETRHCDSVSGTICTVDNALIGNHQETRYKDHFYNLPMQASKVFTQAIPVNFKANKRTVYNIPAGEIKFFRAEIEFEPKSEGEFLIYAESLNNRGKLDPWYSSNYDYKRLITLEADQIATTTSAFPVLATSTEDYLKTTTFGGKIENDNGYDIIFVDDDDSTLLNYEREYYASTTGEIAYWIKTDISSTTDKTIYMYYGKSGASDLATTTGVWDDNFVMVQHLQETPAGTTYDSTSNNNDGTTYNMDSADQVSGQIDGSLDFDGGDDYVQMGAIGNLGSTGSISFWINETSTNNYAYLFDARSDSGTGFMYWKNSDNSLYTGASGGTIYVDSVVSSTLVENDWHFVAVSGITMNIAGDIKFGSRHDLFAGQFHKGIIDEVRISNVARTAGWIETEYNNQVSMGSFLTIGSEQTESAEDDPDTGDLRIKSEALQIKSGTLRIKN